MDRLRYIDVAKGIAIVLVVIGHLVRDREIVAWIFSFHVPLFFFLSGYTVSANHRGVASDESFWNYLMRKVRTLLPAYLLFALVECQFGINNVLSVLYGNWKSLSLAGTDGVLWFVPCYLLASIVFHGMLMLMKRLRINNGTGKAIFVLLLSAAFAGMGQYMVSAIKNVPFLVTYGCPLGMECVPMAVAFMFLGHIMAWSIIKVLKSRVIVKLLPLVMVCVSLFTYRLNLPGSFADVCHVDMCNGTYGDILLFLFNALNMGLAVVFLSCTLQNLPVMTSVLEYLGKKTLIVLCTHMLVHTFVSKAMDLMGLPIYTSFPLQCIDILLTLATLPLICYIMDKYLPAFTGKSV